MGYEKIWREIRGIIQNSNLPEDPIHAENTLRWLLILKPDADEALKLSAFGHDIERAIEEKKVRREDYKSFQEFKMAHALNSALILKEIILKNDGPIPLAEEVFRIVRLHEIGGDQRSDLIRDADSISFFDTNLPYYFKREGVKDTEVRCRWGYNRLSDRLRPIVEKFKYSDPRLEEIMKRIIREY